jgi:hypothetical protein
VSRLGYHQDMRRLVAAAIAVGIALAPATADAGSSAWCSSTNVRQAIGYVTESDAYNGWYKVSGRFVRTGSPSKVVSSYPGTQGQVVVAYGPSGYHCTSAWLVFI